MKTRLCLRSRDISARKSIDLKINSRLLKSQPQLVSNLTYQLCQLKELLISLVNLDKRIRLKLSQLHLRSQVVAYPNQSQKRFQRELKSLKRPFQEMLTGMKELKESLSKTFLLVNSSTLLKSLLSVEDLLKLSSLPRQVEKISMNRSKRSISQCTKMDL
jgi:hypothetical protein